MLKKAILEVNVHASLSRVNLGYEFTTRYKFNNNMINTCLNMYYDNFKDNDDFLCELLIHHKNNEVFYLTYRYVKVDTIEGRQTEIKLCHHRDLRQVIRHVMDKRKENFEYDEFEFIEEQKHMHGDNLIMHEKFNCNGKHYVMQMEPHLILTKGFKDYNDASLLPFLYHYSDISELNNIFENHKVTVIYKYIFNEYNEKKRSNKEALKEIHLRTAKMKNKMKKEKLKPHISNFSPLLSDEKLIELFKDDSITKQPKKKKEKNKSPINDILKDLLSDDSQSLSDIDIAETAEPDIVDDKEETVEPDIVINKGEATEPDIAINQEETVEPDIVINKEEATEPDIAINQDTLDYSTEEEALKESELTIEYKDSIDPNDKPKINHYLHMLYNENQNFKNRMKEYDIIFITKSIHYDLLRSKKSCHFNAKLINKTNAITTNEYHFYIHPFNDKIYSITEINNIF